MASMAFVREFVEVLGFPVGTSVLRGNNGSKAACTAAYGIG